MRTVYVAISMLFVKHNVQLSKLAAMCFALTFGIEDLRSLKIIFGKENN